MLWVLTLALLFFFGFWRTIKFAGFVVAVSALCVVLLLSALLALV